MAGVVWFGTKENAQWIPAPAVDVQAGKVGYASETAFVNGGAAVRRSVTAAKRFGMSWNLARRAEIQPVLDYADGIYGPGPFYYANPFAMNRNMLPAYWAAPFMNAYDGPLRVGNNRPTLVTGTVTNGYPLESAQWSITTASSVPSIFIPIPPGYTAHVGAHGSNLSGTTYMSVRRHVGTSLGATTPLTWLSKTAAPTNWSSLSGDTGITLSFGATANGSFRLDGAVVQVLPAGSPAPSGGFISGQGQSGMLFASQPEVSEYNAVLDRVGVSATLVETEAWN